MNNRTFVNLSTKYRNLLNDISGIITDQDKSGIIDKTITYKRLMDIYNQIDDFILKNECTSYDLDNMIYNYKKKNELLDLLKKFIYLRNRHIIKNACGTEYWKKNMDYLVDLCNKVFSVQCKTEDIDYSFLEVLKEYLKYLEGFWTTIEITKTGLIKNIGIIDIDDYDLLFIYVARKNKWRIRDKKERDRLYLISKEMKNYNRQEKHNTQNKLNKSNNTNKKNIFRS